MERLIKYIGYVLFIPIWWLQLLIPRNKNIWIFGAWNGQRFSDNSRYLFEYVRENHPKIKPIWITRDKKIQEQVNELGGISFLANEPKGIYYSLLAKHYFVSCGKIDVNHLAGNGARWTQLWHGNPMKKIGLDDKFAPWSSFFESKIVPVLFPFIYLFNYDYLVSNAEVFSDKMASAFNMPLNRILETGCPRNDVFYSQEEDAFNKGLKSKFKGCKLLYYLPTFRGHNATKSLFTLEDYSLEKLEDFLEKENLVFISKGHYVDNQLSDGVKNEESRLINLSDENVSDINFMLKDADLLITDYSGAYFDFLLTERPVVFAAFDLEEYLSSSRELYFDYGNIVSGPIAKDWNELMDALKSVWDSEYYKKLTQEKNGQFNKYHDANNSKRVYEAIANLSS